MASWNCSERHNSPSNIVSTPEHGCVALSMCSAAQQRHLCVVPSAAAGASWTMDNTSSPHPVPVAGPLCPSQAVVAAATSVCPQRLVAMKRVHTAQPYLDASDERFCRTSRFQSTSVPVDSSSPCHNSAVCQETCYNPGMYILYPTL